MNHFLNSHIGPIPKEGETQRHYMLRWSAFMSGSGTGLICIDLAVLYLVDTFYRPFADSPVILAINVAAGILFAMGILGGIHSACLALFGKERNAVWSYEEKENC
jgi:hypothetical protein